MSKRLRETREPQGPPPNHIERERSNGLTIATLVGVVVLLVISFSNWREIEGLDQRLGDRFGRLESDIANVSAQVDKVQVAAAPAPARKGLDPNKVYPIKTSGSPIKGGSNAPVIIAEFSDFQ